MLKRLVAVGALAVLVGACASDPYYYGDPYYTSAPGYYTERTPVYVDRYASSAYDSGWGRVTAIDVVGDGGGGSTGAGAVIGGVVGGVLGHQIGSGRGQDAATVAGAIGGALAGNEIEKNRRAGERYRVFVRFGDGREVAYLMDSLQGIRVGDRVRVDGGRIYRD